MHSANIEINLAMYTWIECLHLSILYMHVYYVDVVLTHSNWTQTWCNTYNVKIQWVIFTCLFLRTRSFTWIKEEKIMRLNYVTHTVEQQTSTTVLYGKFNTQIHTYDIWYPARSVFDTQCRHQPYDQVPRLRCSGNSVSPVPTVSDLVVIQSC